MSEQSNSKAQTENDKAEKFAQHVRERMKKENKTFQEVVGIKDEALEELYCAAFAYYNQGKYSEARTLFVLLISISPTNPRFLFGIASVFYQLGLYEEAGLYFALTIHHENSNVMAAYYLSDCFIKQQCFNEALQILNVTLALTEGHPEYEVVKQRSLLLIEGVKARKGKIVDNI